MEGHNKVMNKIIILGNFHCLSSYRNDRLPNQVKLMEWTGVECGFGCVSSSNF